jgi:hypothetical protein
MKMTNQTNQTATAPTTVADYLTTKNDGFPKEEGGRIYADAYDLIGTETVTALATALAAKAGKLVSRFFRNEARRQMKNRSLEAAGFKGTMPKGDRDAAAIAREYRSDR